MWQSRTKNDLIIEVWEKLDCESIGAAEIEAIEVAVADQFGASAVDSPMIIARLLADEGADLRHAEVMKLYLERASDRPYEAAFRNVINIGDLKATGASIKNLENLRRKYKSENDKEGLRLVKEAAIEAKRKASERAESGKSSELSKATGSEIANWFTIWLQTPEIFDSWVELRKTSPDFHQKFGETAEA